MKYPIFSIAIATYNSGRTLEVTLKSVRKQTYPQKKVEILIVDGGSTDNTLELAKKYHCRILTHPKLPQLEMVHAKHIAYLKARGKYMMYLDSDEILESRDSLVKKLKAFQKDTRVRAVSPTGYKAPEKNAAINKYIVEFGDPFTYFYYYRNKQNNPLLDEFYKRYSVFSEDQDAVVFNMTQDHGLPLIELWAGGCSFDLEYAKKIAPQVNKDPGLVAHMFYLLNKKGGLVAMTKRDFTIHNSVESVKSYLRKIDIRIRNNIFRDMTGTSGFLYREDFSTPWLKIKKYLFIPYSLSIILPLIDGIWISTNRRDKVFMIHLPLCLYTIFRIFYYYSLHLLDIKPKFVQLKVSQYALD